jgi:hypothetical protein
VRRDSLVSSFIILALESARSCFQKDVMIGRILLQLEMS